MVESHFTEFWKSDFLHLINSEVIFLMDFLLTWNLLLCVIVFLKILDYLSELLILACFTSI